MPPPLSTAWTVLDRGAPAGGRAPRFVGAWCACDARRFSRAPEGAAASRAQYRELHGANVYSGESVLVARLASDGADGLAGTLERPSAVLVRCAELLEGLGLDAAEVRAAGAMAARVAGAEHRRAARRAGERCRPALLRRRAAADPERELVLTLEAAAPIRASCELAVKLVSASRSRGPGAGGRSPARRCSTTSTERHPALLPRTAALVAACRQRDIPWRPIPGWAGYMQLGEGALQTRTDRINAENRTAVELTSDKTAATGLMNRHGVPVAPHFAITDRRAPGRRRSRSGFRSSSSRAGRTGARRWPSA